MTAIAAPPGWWLNVFTLGIARALWISRTNAAFNRGGAHFLFAWLLQPFANWGLAGRFNEQLAAVGSSHRMSKFWAFWLTGWPFFGTHKAMRRATVRLNDAWQVRTLNAQQQAV